MAEVYGSDKAAQKEETQQKAAETVQRPSLQDTGYDFFVWYLKIMNERTKGNLALTDGGKAAILESQIWFPRMEEIARKAVESMSNEEESDEDSTLSDLLLASDMIFLNAVSRKESGEALLEKLGETYLHAQSLLFPKEEAQEPSKEALEELAALRKAAGSAEAERITGTENMQRIFRELLDETTEDEQAAAAAMTVLQAQGEESDGALVERLRAVLETLGLLESAGGAQPESDTAAGFRKAVLEVWNDFEEEEGLSEAVVLHRIGERLLQAFEAAGPYVIEYFLYRYELDKEKSGAPEKARALAEANGLRGKRAQKYAAKKAALVQKAVESRYDAAHLAFFHGMDILERRVYRVMMATRLMTVDAVPEESFAWNVIFFLLNEDQKESAEAGTPEESASREDTSPKEEA